MGHSGNRESCRLGLAQAVTGLFALAAVPIATSYSPCPFLTQQPSLGVKENHVLCIGQAMDTMFRDLDAAFSLIFKEKLCKD